MIYTDVELERYREEMEKWKNTPNEVAYMYNKAMVDKIENELPVYKVGIYKCKQRGVYSAGYCSDDGQKFFTFEIRFEIYSYNDKYGVDSRERILRNFFISQVCDYMHRWSALYKENKDFRLIVEFTN